MLPCLATIIVHALIQTNAPPPVIRRRAPVARNALDPAALPGLDPGVLDGVGQAARSAFGLGVEAAKLGVEAAKVTISVGTDIAQSEEAKNAVKGVVDGVRTAGEIAVPVVQAGVVAATPIVKSGVQAGVDAAAPAIQAGIDKVQPLMEDGLGKLAPLVEETKRTADTLVRASITEDQRVQLGQVADVAGGVAKGAVAAGKQGVSAAAPMVGKAAKEVGGAVKPIVSDVLQTGTLQEGTVNGLREQAEAASKVTLNGIAAGLRGAAMLIDDPPASATSAAAAGSLPSWLPQAPSVREFTDSMAGSMVRASAPYALGFGLVAVALNAVRELLEPAERIAKQVLAVATLAVITRTAVLNWDTIYATYQLVSGEKPLF